MPRHPAASRGMPQHFYGIPQHPMIKRQRPKSLQAGTAQPDSMLGHCASAYRHRQPFESSQKGAYPHTV
eukprot:3371622-Lingulodinium_polyedra.AAC.1